MSLTIIFSRNVGSIPDLFKSLIIGRTIAVVDGRKFRGISAVDLDKACQDFPEIMVERLKRDPTAIIFCVRHFDEVRDIESLTGGRHRVLSDMTKTQIKDDVTDTATQNPDAGIKEYTLLNKGRLSNFAVFRSPKHIFL